MIESSTDSTQHSQLIQTKPFFNSGSESDANALKSTFPGNSPNDEVTISPEARSINTRRTNETTTGRDSSTTVGGAEGRTELTAEEQREINKLQRRDAEVRAHEQAHLSAAGQHAAGGMSFTYEVGPNGKRYATGGEVPINLSREKTPEETIAKMQQVAKAALAPANPSAADRNIAARANSIAAEARREINDTAFLEENPKTFEKTNSQDSQSEANSELHPTGSRSVERSTPSSFMPSRQLVLRAYAQNS